MAARSTSPALPNSRSPARYKPGTDGTALHVLLPVNALRPDVHGNDRTKVQRRKGVHGLVAVQYAL